MNQVMRVLLTLSQAFIEEVLGAGLGMVPSIKPSLFLAESAIVIALFQSLKLFPEKGVEIKMKLASLACKKYGEAGSTLGSEVLVLLVSIDIIVLQIVLQKKNAEKSNKLFVEMCR